MTKEQFDALEEWISDMIHIGEVRESYLHARKLLVTEPAREEPTK